ncbi:MAG: hypothetical protein E1N59_853 [Puniceicoccaceae bacterium 5H]|nr:MAG: hypothetical protein E1N59_853 [Puniceicoccaceae bacterium 5H]
MASPNDLDYLSDSPFLTPQPGGEITATAELVPFPEVPCGSRQLQLQVTADTNGHADFLAPGLRSTNLSKWYPDDELGRAINNDEMFQAQLRRVVMSLQLPKAARPLSLELISPEDHFSEDFFHFADSHLLSYYQENCVIHLLDTDLRLEDGATVGEKLLYSLDGDTWRSVLGARNEVDRHAGGIALAFPDVPVHYRLDLA